MLYDVLHAIETASGPVLLTDLSRELSIDPDILRDMLAFWQRKGRLRVEETSPGASCSSGTHGTICGANCTGTDNCVFTIHISPASIITVNPPDQ